MSRPVRLEGLLEAGHPAFPTMLSLCCSFSKSSCKPVSLSSSSFALGCCAEMSNGPWKQSTARLEEAKGDSQRGWPSAWSRRVSRIPTPSEKVWWGKLQSVMPASFMASPLPLQLPANASEDDPHSWVPAHHVGGLGGVLCP